MSPFRVQCETCQATFRVRDERVVGQVHACPKCGGMVLLTPPEGLEVEAEGIDEPSTTPQTVEEPAPIIEASPQLSPVEARGRVVAIGVAVGGLAFVAAATVLTLSLRSGDPAVEERPADPTLIAEAESKPDASAPEAPTEQEPAPKAPQTPELPASIDDTGLPDDEPLASVPPAAEPTVERTPTLPRDPIAPASREPVIEQPVPPAAPEPAFEEPSTIDPLDFDPASADLILTRGPRKTAPQPIEPERPAAPGALLDKQLANAAPADERGAIDEGIAARAAGLKVWARLGDTGQTPPPTPAAEALNTVLPEIQLDDWPLERVLNLLSDLGGAPITLPPDALRQTGVTAQRQVTIVGRGQTLGELLDAALRPLSLECVDRGGNLVVARRGGGELHTASYSVNDLADDNGDALVPLVRTALGLDRDGGELSFADGKLSLSAPRSDHYELLVLCEQLRKARGLALRSKYPSELLADRPALVQLASQLDRSATFSFVTATPLRQVFEHWRDELRATLLVDWAALDDLGLTPATPVTTAARDATWRDALDGTLSGLGLTWRAVDSGIIVITTPAAAPGMLDLSAYADRNALRTLTDR